jgi:hypothetical protein
VIANHLGAILVIVAAGFFVAWALVAYQNSDD